MELKHPEQRGLGGQVEIRNNIKIRISKDQNITCSYTISVETGKSMFRFEFKIWVIRICFEFRASSFESYEKIIEQNMILIKMVTSINYEALSEEVFL